MSIHDEGYQSYPANDNPYAPGTAAWSEWDAGYWNAHDMSFQPDDFGGIEEAYGDFYDYDAVSQGMYDDDPSPYAGDYSEM